MSDRANGTLNLTPDTIHGFTSHTHDDDVALIHMNGRVFDPNLARFLSVDPLIQNPLSSQGLNPYSYVGNNPLAGKDPTGYASDAAGPGPKMCDAPGSGDAGCAPQMSTADRIDGFQTVYSASSYMSSSGSMGQGIGSIYTNSVTSGGQGDPYLDVASKSEGNPASPDNNGGSQQGQPPTLDTVTVTAGNASGGWIPQSNVTWPLYYAEASQYKQEVIDSITTRDEDFILGMMLGPLKSPLDLGRGLYTGDSNRTAMGAVGVAAMVVPDAGEASTLIPELRGGLNLFRWNAETTTTASGWREGDYMLNLPNQGSPAANWAQNSSRLREVMREGNPIFDSYRNPMSGTRIPSGETPTSPGRFLRAERELLENHGWQYNPPTGAYHPPQP